ncbi:hypothetical protein FDP41_004638 [Naegleria fowleri]|uniref:Transmembrane protein n=1 Tax=Naegleria fowleri TaxID=5763 RepID=A0A6A5BN71_NAEFO|nr:uncharacterized protein FDP41_004638 [Naegleria fowleri]KAF0976332.1 hypothetical protein FDP41_004638 [Naegleria fowleri]
MSSLSPPSPRTFDRNRSDSVSSSASSTNTTTPFASSSSSLLNPPPPPPTTTTTTTTITTTKKKKSSRKLSSSSKTAANHRNGTTSLEFAESLPHMSKSTTSSSIRVEHYHQQPHDSNRYENIRINEVQPLLHQVEMEMNQLRMTRTQFKLSCNLVLNIMIFILNMVFLCLLSCVLAYVLSPIYVNHDVHEFQVGGSNSVDSSNGIIPFSAVSVDGNGHVYQGFGMGFSYSSVQTNYSQEVTGQFRTVSFYPHFDSILVVRPEYQNNINVTFSDIHSKSFNNGIVILSSWILKGGKQYVQPIYIFKNMTFIPQTIDQVFIHCIHHVEESQQTVMMIHVKNTETKELFLYLLIGQIENETSHVFQSDPILIYNYTFPSWQHSVEEELAWSNERILASSSMAIILKDSQKQVGVVSHRFDDNTCRYYLFDLQTQLEAIDSFKGSPSSSPFTSNGEPSRVKISQLTLQQGISCYSVDLTTLHMEEKYSSRDDRYSSSDQQTLQTLSLIATESVAILLNGIQIYSTQPIPTCRKGYQFSELSNGYKPDLNIQVRNILGGKFIFSCLNNHDGSVSMLYGQIVTTTNNYEIMTGTSFSTVIPGRVTNAWLVHSTKNVLEPGVREYDVFLTYEYLEDNMNSLDVLTMQHCSSKSSEQKVSPPMKSFYTIKCTTPTQTLSHDEYPVCSTPFKHLSFSPQTLQYDISSIAKFGVLFTTLSSTNLSPTAMHANLQHPKSKNSNNNNNLHQLDNKYFVLSTELSNWQGGYKWIGICISSGSSFGTVKVAQRGLVTFSNMQQELIEGSSYYANIDGSITRKTTPWYIGYALTKKQLYIDSSFVK